MTVGDEKLVTATATVKEVNLEKRELVLTGPLGDEVDVTVDKSVKRLDEIKPGDQVTVKYYVSVAAELREPTDEEKPIRSSWSLGQRKLRKTALRPRAD
jgi:hypothetical protein